MVRAVFLLFLCSTSFLYAAPLRVGVSVLPMESIVGAIGGEQVEVQSLQREGDSCSVFEPRPSVVSWLAGAGLFLRIGAGYESVIMEKLQSQFPDLRIRDLREAAAVLPLHGHNHDGHDHADCGACSGHAGGETDPHLWLDPVRVAQMGGFIANELAGLRPGEAALFQQNQKDLQERANALDERLVRLLGPYRGRAFYIYHPALGYFAGRYGLRQVAISGAGQAPSVKELHRLVARAREDRVRTIFVQPQESRKHAEIVADAVGAEIVEIDPMEPDWEKNILQIGEALANSFVRE
ncbi:MAG: metal ABC transporter solute-binding protein, Zn/Mn family [Oceanipulchritudo sp.]